MTGIVAMWEVLSPLQRRRALRLGILLFGAMILEMIGVGLVVPALALLSSAGGADVPPGFARWLEWAAPLSRPVLIAGGVAAVLGLYLFRGAYLLLVSHEQAAFVADLQHGLSRRLFSTYLARPWADHLERHSADMLRSVAEMDKLANACTALLSAVAELLILAGVLGLLVWFEPLGALAIGGVAALGTLVLMRATRRRLFAAGHRAQDHLAAGMRDLQQAAAGVKDILLLGCAPYFTSRYAAEAAGLARSRQQQAFLVQVPRLWYELVAVVSLCMLMGILAWQDTPAGAIVPTLGLFAVAAFRMLPSVNRIATGLQTVAFFTPAVAAVTEELRTGAGAPPRSPAGRLAFRHEIRLEGVSFRYAHAARDAITNVDLTIPHGASIGLTGGSGAGKTTVVDLILGLLHPSTGRITVDGIDIASDMPGWQRIVGYVPQTIHLTDDSIRRNIAFGVPDASIDEAAINRALAAARLTDFVSGLPLGVETPVGERGVRLSGGQRQRIGIARALYRDPEVLVLDEATSNLDTATEAEVMAAVNALHGIKTTIIVAHRLSTVAGCDRAWEVEAGRLVTSVPRLPSA
ncbi:MAG: ABC transporter ATP-binding protein [Planctomycetaceae bacterium]